MKTSWLLLTAAVAAIAVLLTGSLITPQKTEAAPPSFGGVTIPVDSSLQGGGSFVGDITAERFFSQDGQLFVEGTATGTLTTAGGIITELTDAPFTAPVSDAGSDCEILDLVIGPIDLNLLGLVVTTETIHLNITAEPGSGNLLGNLLCGVAGLLDSNSPSSTLANVLNRILGLLG